MHSYCCYTHRTTVPYVQPAEYDVKKFRDAIKGDPINMYASLPVCGQWKHLEQSNAEDVVDWFGQMAAAKLKELKIKGVPVFVPVPDSKCTVKSKRATKTKRLADALLNHYGSGDVVDVLRFAKEMPSSHSERGPREAKLIFAELRTIGKIDNGRPCIIVDDVMTSGGHLQAVTAELQNQKANVVFAMCALKASQEAVANPFAAVVIDFDVVSLYRV